jgi:hypothetical protein
MYKPPAGALFPIPDLQDCRRGFFIALFKNRGCLNRKPVHLDEFVLLKILFQIVVPNVLPYEEFTLIAWIGF